MELREKRLFLLDIDGTVCKGEVLIDGTIEFLNDVREQGGQYVFITNNATKSVADYIVSFRRLGIETTEENFMTASCATTAYLQQKHAGELIYVLGTESFLDELRRNQIRVTTDWTREEIGCALISYDNQLTYEKLTDTCRVLNRPEVAYLATNPDLVCPVEFGYVPDCGSICQMLGHAVKRTPFFIGKPEPAMVLAAVRQTDFTMQETLVVGDRIYTDILCGKNAGVDTALVFSGEADEETVQESDVKPDGTFESIRELHEAWRNAREEEAEEKTA